MPFDSNCFKHEDLSSGLAAADQEDNRGCQTKEVVNEISECLVHLPVCRHFYSFGNAIFCKHPLHRKFRKRTPGAV